MEDIIYKDPLSRVFILIDNNNRITRIEGEYTLPQDLAGWIQIDEGEGDKYNLAQTHYLAKSIITDEGVYRYKYENQRVVERSQREIEDDLKLIPVEPTQMEQLEAQVFYTAAMTNTLLEDNV